MQILILMEEAIKEKIISATSIQFLKATSIDQLAIDIINFQNIEKTSISDMYEKWKIPSINT